MKILLAWLIATLFWTTSAHADGVPFIVKAAPESALASRDAGLLGRLRADKFVTRSMAVEIDPNALNSTVITVAIDDQAYQLIGKPVTNSNGLLWTSTPGSLASAILSRSATTGAVFGSITIREHNYNINSFGGRHAILHERKPLPPPMQRRSSSGSDRQLN